MRAVETMICPIRRHGATHAGTATVKLERGALTFVASHVPATVCANCGEAYLDSSTTKQVMRMTEEAAASRAQVDVRAFRAASTAARPNHRPRCSG